MIGESVGNHRIISKIGQGGMGTVYEAEDTRLGRKVAIKFLNQTLTSNPRELARFQSEAKVQARLNHPNIVTLHEFEPYHDSYYMVMEYVVGKNLGQLVRSHGALPGYVVVTIAKQALEGLGTAHRMGVVHRDLKPSNIMLTPEGVAKVMDFGIAKVKDVEGLTATGALVGTVYYMSPEQVRGEGVDTRSDIYSFGVILFELLTGRVPFKEESDFSIMMHHVKTPPPPPTQFLPEIPGPLEDIVLRCLEKEPSARYQDVQEIVSALEIFEEQERAMGRGQNYTRRALAGWVSESAAASRGRPAGATAPASDQMPTVKSKPPLPPASAGPQGHQVAPAVKPAQSRKGVAFLIAAMAVVVLVGLGLAYYLVVRSPALQSIFKRPAEGETLQASGTQVPSDQPIRQTPEKTDSATAGSSPAPLPAASASDTGGAGLQQPPGGGLPLTTSSASAPPARRSLKTADALPEREKSVSASTAPGPAATAPNPSVSPPQRETPAPMPQGVLIFFDLDQSGERLALGMAQARLAEVLKEAGHKVVSSGVVGAEARAALDRGDLAQLRRKGIGYVVLGIANGSLESQNAYGSTYYVGKVSVTLELVRMDTGGVGATGSGNAKSRGTANAGQALADALLTATSDAARELARQFQP